MQAGLQHAFLGIAPEQMTPQIAQESRLSVSYGVLVANVTEGSAATKAGMQAGDVIFSAAGRRIEIVEDLFAALRRTGAGKQHAFGIVRDGRRTTVTATLDARPG